MTHPITGEQVFLVPVDQYKQLIEENRLFRNESKMCETCSDAVTKEQLEAFKADAKRLDALQDYPYAIQLAYNDSQPKSDSVPSLRSQIDAFLSRKS